MDSTFYSSSCVNGIGHKADINRPDDRHYNVVTTGSLDYYGNERLSRFSRVDVTTPLYYIYPYRDGGNKAWPRYNLRMSNEDSIKYVISYWKQKNPNYIPCIPLIRRRGNNRGNSRKPSKTIFLYNYRAHHHDSVRVWINANEHLFEVAGISVYSSYQEEYYNWDEVWPKAITPNNIYYCLVNRFIFNKGTYWVSIPGVGDLGLFAH